MSSIEKKLKAEKNTRKVLTKLTFEYLQNMQTLDSGGFPSSQAHSILMFYQPDPKDNFSP